MIIKTFWTKLGFFAVLVGLLSIYVTQSEEIDPKQMLKSSFPKRSLYPFSTHICKGDRTSLSEWEQRQCLFRSVCLNTTNGDWLYFVEPDGPDPIILQDNGTIIDFPEQFFRPGYFLYGCEERMTHWFGKFHTRRGLITETNAEFLEAAVHVIHGYGWFEHFGHSLSDGLIPLYFALSTFNLITDDFQVLEIPNHGNCMQLAHFEKILKHGSKHEPICLLSKGRGSKLIQYGKATLPKKELVCFDKLLAGMPSGFFPLRQYTSFPTHQIYNNGRETVLRNFRDFISDVNGLSPSVDACAHQHVVIVHKKGGSHPQQPLYGNLAEKAQDWFGVHVSVVEIAQLSFIEQLKLMQNTTVLVTTAGGISFVGALLPPKSAVILFDYFQDNRPRKMDTQFWTSFSNVKEFHYMYTRNEVIMMSGKSNYSRTMKVSPYRFSHYLYEALKYVEVERGWKKSFRRPPRCVYQQDKFSFSSSEALKRVGQKGPFSSIYGYLKCDPRMHDSVTSNSSGTRPKDEL